MKLKAAIILLTILSTAQGSVNCIAKKDSQTIWDVSKTIPEQKKVLLSRFEEFSFYLKRISRFEYELEIYDKFTPARNYASATIWNKSTLNWSLWRRDILLSISCSSQGGKR